MKNNNVLDYIHEAEELEKLFLRFMDSCYEHKISDYNSKLYNTSITKPIQRELLKRYEIWFAVTKRIVKQYSDNYSEFENNYAEVKNHILMTNNVGNKISHFYNFIATFDKQVNILHTIIPIISLEEANFKKLITADLLDSELSQAELLYKHDYYRASGSIAGVVLERYLKTLCEVNQVDIGEKDTIEPLATKLYKSEKIPEFDITLFKSIQHLASIRNKCDHPKEEPKQNEVRELLDKVKKITYLGL